MGQDKPLAESRLRSVLKSLSWRILASSTTMGITLLITGELHMALKVGGIEALAKMFIYYFHERAWQALPRGSVRKMLGLHREMAPRADSPPVEPS